MENNTKKNTIPAGYFNFAIILGVITLLIAAYMEFGIQRDMRNFIKTTATVTNVEDDTFLVTYECGGNTYSDIEVSFTKNHSVGDKVTVYVSKEDYNQAASDQFNQSIFRRFLILGLVFLALGIVCRIIRRKIIGPEDAIITGGKYIYADVTDIEYNTAVTNEEGLHPYTLKCHYEDFSGKKQIDFTLPLVYTDPKPYLKQNNNKIKVYYKGKNLKKVSLDESILKEI